METPSWPIFVVSCLTFVIGALLLWRIALNPIQRILKERRERIMAAQDEAEGHRRNAEKLQRELEDRLAMLEADSKKRTQKAEVEAGKLKEELSAAARGAAQAIVAQGRGQMKAERAGMRDEIRRDVARLSVSMAKKVAGMALTAKDRKRLVQRVLRELPGRLTEDA